jgi:RNA polymerase sigma factor (sigma-70 family)
MTMTTQQLPVQSSGDALVDALVRERAQALIWFARRLSSCVEDAEDATQNALVKLLVRMRDEPPRRVMSWLLTVLRHEAFAVHAARRRALADLPFDDAREGSAVSDPAEVVERRLALVAAMRTLKPQERHALGLRAIGLSYAEICDAMSWTYTRCNRSITEGRRALWDRLDADVSLRSAAA